MGTAHFEMFRGENNQFYFRLRAANGEPILASEGYVAKAGCQKGIDSVKKNAESATNFDRKESQAGEPYFVLKAVNHEVISTSEMYKTGASMENGIEAVMRVAPEAPVEDET